MARQGRIEPEARDYVTVRCGDRTITIETSNPDLMRIKLAEVAGMVAAGLASETVEERDGDETASVYRRPEWVAHRALEVAAEIMIGVRP